MPLGANTNTTKQNGTQPNQENQKIFQKNLKFSQPFQKLYPTQEILESKA